MGRVIARTVPSAQKTINASLCNPIVIAVAEAIAKTERLVSTKVKHTYQEHLNGIVAMVSIVMRDTNASAMVNARRCKPSLQPQNLHRLRLLQMIAVRGETLPAATVAGKTCLAAATSPAFLARVIRMLCATKNLAGRDPNHTITRRSR